MELQDFELNAFFAHVVETLERINIPYMVVGGFAAILHGEPRFTADVDIVADMQLHHVKPFIASFPFPRYYVSEEAILDCLQRRYPFNVIEPSTGAKVDIVPLPRDLFTRFAFQRRERLDYDDTNHSAVFISSQDIVLAKLIAYKETGSDKHLRDARGVLVTQWETLDLEVIRRATDGADVRKEFEQLVELVRKEMNQ